MFLRIARRILTPLQRLFREIRRGPSDTHEAPFLSPEWDWTPVKPWPRFQDIALPSGDRLEVFLFLQIYYRGGVWEATKDLVHQLVEVNRERGCLHLTLGLHPDQVDVKSLESLGEDLRITRMRFTAINRDSIGTMLGGTPRRLMSSADPGFCFFSGGAEEGIRADAWFGLLDRFPLPLLPLRPYGVLIYDMLQRHLPEIFGPPGCDFFHWCKGGMIPTAKRARFVAVTTPQTQRDVMEEYGLPKQRVRLLPLGSDPDRRFAAVHPEPIAVPREPYILKVANAAHHKGAGVLLQAYAKLKQFGHQDLPPIVCCGSETHRLSSAFRGEIDHPNGPRIRALVPALGLKEGIDVVFLGFVTESQLKYLYEHSSVVVNAGKWDNGSYSLIEAAYFGKPVISSLYPAAEFICQRFGVQAKFFPIDDSDALAELLRQPLAQEAKSISREEIADIRRRLADPELRTRRYAERLYDCLVELAQEGRRLRVVHAAKTKLA